MSTSVTDESAHREKKIINAAWVIGKSAQRLEVFKAIYTGKMKVKSLEYVRVYAKLATTKRVLELGKKLAAERIIDQVRRDKRTAYQKI